MICTFLNWVGARCTDYIILESVAHQPHINLPMERTTIPPPISPLTNRQVSRPLARSYAAASPRHPHQRNPNPDDPHVTCSIPRGHRRRHRPITGAEVPFLAFVFAAGSVLRTGSGCTSRCCHAEQLPRESIYTPPVCMTWIAQGSFSSTLHHPSRPVPRVSRPALQARPPSNEHASGAACQEQSARFPAFRA